MSYKLEDVSGIGKATAERLKTAKIDSVEKLANAKPEDLLKLKIKGVGKATAEKYIANAKKMLKETEENAPKDAIYLEDIKTTGTLKVQWKICGILGYQIFEQDKVSYKFGEKLEKPDISLVIRDSKTEIPEQSSGEVKEKPEEKSDSKPKAKPRPKPVSKAEVSKLKELIKQQAECNIGLVGHVDHGIY